MGLVAFLPAAARSGDFSALARLAATTAETRPDDAEIIQRLMDHVAKGLVRIERGDDDKQLGHSLAKLSSNVANQNVDKEVSRDADAPMMAGPIPGRA